MSLLEPQYIIDETGKKIRVVLDMKTYAHLLELIEDFSLGKQAQNVLKTESREDYERLDDIRDELLKE